MSDYIYIVWGGVGYLPNEPVMMLVTSSDIQAEDFLRGLRAGSYPMPAYYPLLESVRIERVKNGVPIEDGTDADWMTIDQALGPVL